MIIWVAIGCWTTHFACFESAESTQYPVFWAGVDKSRQEVPHVGNVHFRFSWVIAIARRSCAPAAYHQWNLGSATGSIPPFFPGTLAIFVSRGFFHNCLFAPVVFWLSLLHIMSWHPGMLRQHESGFFTIFVSHRWSSWSHPDPSGEKLVILQRMLQNLMDGSLEVSYLHLAKFPGGLGKFVGQDH